MNPPIPICRDCGADVAAAGATRCPACRSPRLLDHPERDDLTIAHVDCDAFFAAIEKRDDPSLANRPVIVGGGHRGVVATCCYVARIDGVRSAMPMFKALKLCPQAVVIRPDMEKYARAGRQVREMMLALTPLVEPVSIDEAFLDLSGTQALHHGSPARTLTAFARRVEAEIGISVSIGLSYNKFLAKIASERDKPRGFAVIGRAEAKSYLAPRPITTIPGVGKATAERLARDGFRTIGDVQNADLATLVRRLGEEGLRLHALANGVDPRAVKPERETKSVSAETTFNVDISTREALEPILLRLCEKVASRLKAKGLSGRTVTLKLKTADFQSSTRAQTLHEPTRLAGRIFAAASPLLARETTGRAFRLIGVGVSDLADMAEADRGDLADAGVRREVAREDAIDSVRQKFGADAVQRGRTFAAGITTPRKPSAERDV